MNNSIEYTNPVIASIGFDTIARMQEAKLNLDAAGKAGLVSFFQACIATGFFGRSALVEAAERISGPHIVHPAECVLDEYQGIHWDDDGYQVHRIYRWDNA